MNLAMALFQMGKYRACITECNEALVAEPGSVKALYRRAAALEALGELEDAIADLKACQSKSGAFALCVYVCF